MKTHDTMEEHPFLEQIERHGAAISRMCRMFCSTAEDHEDLRQEILLNLWRGWKNYCPDHKTITWIYRVALNTAISWKRHQKRSVETLSIEGFDLPEDSILREQSAHLKALLSMLPNDDQRLINLYLDGFSTEEIGRLLGITQTNVTTRIGRIKEKLRRMDSSEL